MRKIKGILCSVILCACCATTSAETTSPALETGDSNVSLRIDARLDGNYTRISGFEQINNETYSVGLEGTYLKLLLNGKINDKFSYSFRYRLYKSNVQPQSFFNATDWVNLTYAPDEHWSVSAGKQVVLVGTYEYDYAPIDVYFASEYWNHCNPYQMGVTVGYRFNEGNQLLAQVSNSPYSIKSREGTFAYNLMWYGKIAPWFNTMYSINMMEYEKGRFINYLALGNRFSVGPATLDIDWMNRYGGHGTNFFKDYTLMGQLDLKLTSKLNVQLKAGHDYNKAQSIGSNRYYDTWVEPGTDRVFWGCAVEYHPVVGKRNKVRLHACYHSAQQSSSHFLIGVRWQMDVLKLNF